MADIKNTFSKGLTLLNVKTSTFLESNKIKTYIATLKTEIMSLKTEIGNEVYENWAASGTLNQELIQEKLHLIQEKEELIKVQEKEAALLTEKEKQILGVQEEKAEESSVLPVLTCTGCGQIYEQPTKFCRKCGTRMN